MILLLWLQTWVQLGPQKKEKKNIMKNKLNGCLDHDQACLSHKRMQSPHHLMLEVAIQVFCYFSSDETIS